MKSDGRRGLLRRGQAGLRRLLIARVGNVDPVLVIVCMAIASTQTAWSVVVPVLPLYATEFGANATQLGLLIALFGIGRLVVNIPAGMLSERLDPRKMLLVSVACVVVLQAVTAFAPSLTVLLVLRFVAGLAGGMAITSGMTLVVHLTSSADRGRAMSLLQGCQLIGGAFGPALGGLVASLWGYRAPFLACGLLATLVLVFGARILLRAPATVEGAAVGSDALSREPATVEPAAVEPAAVQSGAVQSGAVQPEPAQPGSAQPAAPERSLLRRLLGDGSFLAICAVGFSVFLNRFAGTQSLVPIIAYTVVGLSVGQLGGLMGAVTFTNLILVTIVGRLSDRIGRKRVIVPGLLVVAVSQPVYALTSSPMAFVLVTLLTGIALGFSGPTPAAYMADVAPADGRGTAVGIYRTFGDLAAVIGPIGLGWLVDHTGYQAAVLTLAGVMLAATVIFATVARETVGPRAAHPHATRPEVARSS
nr:MFS transporter [Actinopolymorpha pittospori]